MPDYRTGASQELPLDFETAWAAGRAAESIFEWAGWDGATPPDDLGGLARQGFLLYDAANPDLRASYIAPFALVLTHPDGRVRLTASADGVDAARNTLDSLDNVGADARAAAREVLHVYDVRISAERGTAESTDLGEAQAGGGSEQRAVPLIVIVPLERSRGGLITPGAEIPDRLLDQIHDRSVLAETPIYTLSSVASNSAVDYYGTRMRTNSLRNYVEDAQAGNPFCNSHNTDVLPFGRSYDGHFKANRGSGLSQTFVDTYVPVDLNVNGTDTTHLVKGIRTGVVRDISIGFDPESIYCSLDGKRFPMSFSELFDALDDEEDGESDYCLKHFPKVDYKVDGKKVMCVGEVDNARMIEHSPVYRGATPGAQIQHVGSRAVQATSDVARWALDSPGVRHAARMAEAGKLDRYAADFLEQHTRGLRFPSTTTRRFPGARLLEHTELAERSDTCAGCYEARGTDDLEWGYCGTCRAAGKSPNFVVGGKRGLPINDSRSWDGSAAKASIWAWAGWKGNTAPSDSGGKTRQGFVIYDSNAPDLKGSYHLPFAQVLDGTLTAIGNGVRNAKSRLPQMNGLSAETENAAEAFLDSYMKRLQKDSDGSERTTLQEDRMHPEDGTTRSAATAETPPQPDPEPADEDEEAGDDASLDPEPEPAPAPAQANHRGQAAMDLSAGVRSLLVQHGLVAAGWDGDVLAQVGTLCRDLREMRGQHAAITTEVQDLRSWADTGHQLRDQMAKEIRSMGVQAFGNDYPESVYAHTLSQGSVQQLVDLKAFFAAERRRRLGPGGRVTQDVPDGTADSSGSSGIPPERAPLAHEQRRPVRAARAAFRTPR